MWCHELIKLVIIALLALAPGVEVRGALPITYYYFSSDPYMKTLGVLLAIMTNLIIAPVTIALLSRIDEIVRGWVKGPLSRVRELYLKVVGRAHRLGRRYVGAWGYLGLALFVAIPLPGSGAWTGSLIAYIFGLKYKWSVLSVEAGVLIASALILATLEGGLKVAFLFHS